MKLIPSTDYENYYDIARFELTWKICLFLTIALPFLAISFLLFDQNVLWPTLTGLAIASGMLVTLKYTKKYRATAVFFSLFGTTLCQFTLLFFPHEYHLVDLFWIMIIILYSFFTLGKIWGIVCLVTNIAGIIFYLFFVLNDNLELVGKLHTAEITALSVNFLITGAVITYLLFQFLDTTRFAEKKYMHLTSELKEKNLEVEQQNVEKTMMLKEIHHRVKNNLQVITSLLRLQSKDLTDHATQELFRDSTNRVVAMALIHEKMYQSKGLATINLEQYLSALLDDLIISYSVEIPIKIKIKSEVQGINNESLVPVALIFNELVSNSLKHAFVNQKEGEISILIERRDGSIFISYFDNGVWLEKQKENSFGLELIESLTEQLDGKFVRKTNQGTIYEFTLPDNL